MTKRTMNGSQTLNATSVPHRQQLESSPLRPAGFRSKSRRATTKTRRDRLQFERLEHRYLMASDPLMLQDINERSNLVSSIDEMRRVGSNVFFAARSIDGNQQLWKTNGTEAGTVLMKDFGASAYGLIGGLFNYNGTLVFRGNDGTHGSELWKSDGTQAGTVMVGDMSPGASSFSPGGFTVANGTLYFFGRTATHGRELWKSNGTAAGTVLVRDIRPGSNSSSINDNAMVNVNGTIYFSANNGVSGYELWRSNGTSSGTTLVRNIAPGGDSSNPRNLTNVDGILYFSVSSFGNSGLWASLGSALTTLRVAEVGHDLENFVVLDETLYLTAGGKLVKYENSAAEFIAPNQLTEVSELAEVNGKLYFTAEANSSTRRLVVTNGTSAGTQVISITGNDVREPRALTNWNGTLYFNFSPSSTGASTTLVYQSAGTSATTAQVSWLTGPGNGQFTSGVSLGSTWIFKRESADPDFSDENVLWRTNGTAAGTREVKPIITESSSPASYTQVGDQVFFTATDGEHGRELYVINLAESATDHEMVADIFPGAVGSNPSNLTAFAGKLYFTATTFAGTELWLTDGTEAGTELLDLLPGLPSSSPTELVVVGGFLYFTAFNSTAGRELWRITTSSQPTMVRDIRPGSGSSAPSSLTNVNGTLYFAANDGTNGVELWKSNGSSASTVMVRNIATGGANSNPSQLTAVGSRVFFQANNGTNGTELWVSDGTLVGTVLTRDIFQLGSSTPSQLVNLNGTLVFAASDSSTGRELWRSNGTTSGTYRLRDINPGTESSTPTNLINVNGTLYFRAVDSTGDTELWKSNGTSTGTVLVKNINPNGPSSPTQMANVAGFLYFRANDDLHGSELWRSNGTEAGTDLVMDIAPGATSSNPANIVRAGQNVYFAGFHQLHGAEAYHLDLIPGSVGNDSLTIKYSSPTVRDKVTIQRNTTRGPITMGVFPANETLQLRGGDGVDTLTFEGNPDADTFQLVEDYVVMGNFAVEYNFATKFETIVFNGAAGDDEYRLTPNDHAWSTIRIVESGVGRDTLDFTQSSSPVSVNLGTTSLQTTANGDLLLQLASAASIEDMRGSMFSDTLIGNSLDNDLFGFSGDDILRGNAGNDDLSGGLGSDTYQFGNAVVAESDAVFETTEGEVDTISFALATDPVTFDLAGNNTQAIMNNRSLGVLNLTLIENVTGGSGNDILRGNDADNLFVGGPGNDLLVGRLGNDTYRFAAATSSEADQITEAVDQGVDTVSFEGLSADVTFALNTSVVQNVHTNRTLKLNGPGHFENLIGGQGNDVLTGNSMSNLIIGNQGNDQINGLNNRDILIGGLGADVISGGLDEDVLIAGRTSFDANHRAFDSVFAEWKSSATHATRVINVRAGVGTPVTALIATSTVLNDNGALDDLTGGPGTDWFFRAIDDLITDLNGEIVDQL